MEKILKCNKWGGQINGGLEFKKRLTMIINQQIQVVIQQKTKIHTEACHFAWKLNPSSTNKKRKCNKEFVKTLFSSKLINGGPNKVQGVEKLISGGAFIRHLRVPISAAA